MLENVPLYIINLAKDTERYQSIRSYLTLANDLRVTRIDAVYGRQLPLSACMLLSGNVAWAKRRGEIGCFLSHLPRRAMRSGASS